jgi:hypothetical protein
MTVAEQKSFDEPVDSGSRVISRYEASFYHFLISFVVFVVLAYFVLFRWYPEFFYTIDGGWEGMRIIIGVDLILGPLLTLVVFKAGKPGLKFDLSMIAIIHSVCLQACLWCILNVPSFLSTIKNTFTA